MYAFTKKLQTWFYFLYLLIKLFKQKRFIYFFLLLIFIANSFLFYVNSVQTLTHFQKVSFKVLTYFLLFKFLQVFKTIIQIKLVFNLLYFESTQAKDFTRCSFLKNYFNGDGPSTNHTVIFSTVFE